jgi:hypothetical protein
MDDEMDDLSNVVPASTWNHCLLSKTDDPQRDVFLNTRLSFQRETTSLSDGEARSARKDSRRFPPPVAAEDSSCQRVCPRI